MYINTSPMYIVNCVYIHVLGLSNSENNNYDNSKTLTVDGFEYYHDSYIYGQYLNDDRIMEHIIKC